MSDRVELCTLEKLQEIVDERQYKQFVWEDEWLDGDQWLSSNPKNPSKPIPVEPLIVDATSANLMLTVYNALSVQKKAQFREWVGKTRGHFGFLFDKCCEIIFA